VTTWLESLGVRDVADYLRVPANPRFGMAARVCVPVRFDGTLLGYLWLIDEPDQLSGDDVEASLRCAEELGVALYRARRLEHEDRERERELVGQLVGRRDGEPAVAAAELLRDGFLAATPAYALMVAEASSADGQHVSDAVRLRLAAGAEHLRRAMSPRHLLLLVGGEQVVCVFALAAPDELERRARALVEAMQENLRDSPGWSATVGVSAVAATAGELRRGQAQAQDALRLGRRVAELGPYVLWSSLGAYRILARLLGPADPAPLLPEPVVRLLAAGDGTTLAETLECYLDHGTDARAAAAALFVHRSSLYGRLRRIEEIAGVDLRSGEDRLELHLGLRLWRMGGGAAPPA
jgi:sugar diacid utilization regulator